MSTFQAVVYAIVHGFSEILPVAPGAHDSLISTLLGWSEPGEAFGGVLQAGVALALLVFFRHDWASIFSSAISVIIFRRKPMMIDERLPFFIVITSLPGILAWLYVREHGLVFWNTPHTIAASLIGLTLVLFYAESRNRKTKRFLDWNWSDSLILGFTQLTLLIPGGGRQLGALAGSFFRNYQFEATSKFLFLTFFPFVATQAYVGIHQISWHSGMPLDSMSWLTLIAGFLVSFLTALLTMGGLMKNLPRRGTRGYSIYRVILALGILGAAWYRS